MKRRLFLFLSLMLCCLGLSAEDVYEIYIAQYRETALEHEKEYKIPAAITLAQGLLESGAGQSELAKKANNHFGIKCTSDWTGATYKHDDDRAGECFRKYKHASESYVDHAIFLQRKRYASLFALDIHDYKGWAKGLSQCGYATDPKYPNKLIELIERYGLDHLNDTQVVVSTTKKTESSIKDSTIVPIIEPQTVEPVISEDTTKEVLTFSESAAMGSVTMYSNHKSGIQNGVRYVVAKQGESFASMAYDFNIREKMLRRYNDATDGREIEEGDRVYIYPKHRRSDRKHRTYYVRKGDSAWSISQKFGMRMKTLYELNGIPEGTELVTRQKLVLR
ncbi:MAG: glucosaminidase domain-containing protein [Bacteroidales bacterium]|nr:glucosaminidase domain-containing protein [Candidatus Colicola coprequi]